MRRMIELTRACISLVRPTQWLKNLMVYFPLFLGGAFSIERLNSSLFFPFISFCCASSATYILNDIIDRENDARHPKKKKRPIAAGLISGKVASLLGTILLVTSIVFAYAISNDFVLFVILYLLVSMLYSLKFKQIPVVDIFCIAIGFLIRLEAGTVAFHIPSSDWLFLTVFLLAVFLGTGKRLAEMVSLGEEARSHRKSLDQYPDGFLGGAMYMTGSAVLVTYTMYVINRHMMVYTVPLCAFGLFRFIFLVQSGSFGDPTESLVKDRVLFLVGFCWTIMVGWAIYGK